jgi:hypothetical protein
MIVLACQGTNAACFGNSSHPPSRTHKQGLTVNVNEPSLVSKGRTQQEIGQSLTEYFPGSLGQWFTVTKGTDIPDAVMELVGDNAAKLNVVWIDIGTGSPWVNDDVRLKRGMSRADIDNLRQWGIPLKEHIASISERLARIPHTYGNAPFQPSRMASQYAFAYRNILNELFLVCFEAKHSDLLNTNALETVLFDAPDYQHQRIDDIKDLLQKLSAGIK